MSILKKCGTLLVLCSIFFLVTSCEKNVAEIAENTETTLTLDLLVEQLEDATAKEGNGIFVEFDYNPNTEEVIIKKKEEKELGIEYLFIYEQNEVASSRAKYKISCDNEGNDGKDSWEEDCSGVRACGKLVKKCLDGGGCSTICTTGRIVTVPEIRTHFVYSGS
ncbi:MAG: hypothetical protein AB8G86_01835 [Saprospiraceae bacterium]